MEQPILPLRDAPVLADAAAVWFSRRWGIPAESYRESMEQCLRRKAPVPPVVRGPGRRAPAGRGRRHRKRLPRPEGPDAQSLRPVCGAPWRGRGTAGRLLDFIRRDLGAMGIPRLYLVTDHTAFYERYGWTFLTMVTGDDHLPERMYTAPTLPPASGARVPPDTISP